jgi:AAA15 family ATPase/GTPase
VLIRFGVENYLSIRDKQEISLVASVLKDNAADLLNGSEQLKLLPAAIVYGANASGKSNLISTLAFLRDTVRYSHERGDADSGVTRSPFKLDNQSKSNHTRVDVDFLIDGVRYHYGFAADDVRFQEEWLYAFPSGKKQTWYHRDSDNEKIYFGKQLKGASKTIESLMRPNSLFLSVAAQNAHRQLTPIYRHLTGIVIKNHIENSASSAVSAFSNGKIDQRIIDFLRHADTGIVNYKFDESPYKEEVGAMVVEMAQVLAKHLAHSSTNLPNNIPEFQMISLGHETNDAPPLYLDLNSESSGTLRLLVLLKSIFSALDQGSLVIIDELDASLHTYLSESIVRLFNSKTTNPRGAQLIATTHDTNLLCGDLLRRDQIWFAEKDRAGATALYPLTDIRVRNGQNLEKGYLEGRFGAVPFLGSPELLLGSKE